MDAQTGQPIRSLLDPNILGNKAHTDYVSDASFSPDDSIIVTSSYDKTVKTWSAHNGQLIQTLQDPALPGNITHDSSVTSVAFSPSDGKTIITGSLENKIKLWDINTGQPLHTIQVSVHPYLSGRFSHDGRKIIIASDIDTVKILNVQTGQPIQTFRDPNIQGNATHTGIVNDAKFSPDDSKVVTSDTDTVKIWEVQTGQLILTLRAPAASGNTTHSFNYVAFGPDGKTIIAGLYKSTLQRGHFVPSVLSNGTVKILNVQTGQLVWTLQDPDTLGNTTHDSIVNYVASSPDGKTIITGSWDKKVKKVKKWYAQTGQLIQTLQDPNIQGNTTTSGLSLMKFSYDSKIIITASRDGTVKIWDSQVENKRKQKVFDWFKSELRPDQAAVIARLHKAKLQGKKLVLEDDLFTFNTMPKHVRLLLIEYLGVTRQKPWYERIGIYIQKLIQK